MLSAVAKAEQGIQDNNTQERIDSPMQSPADVALSARLDAELDTDSDKADREAFRQLSTERSDAAIAPLDGSIMAPTVGEMRSPQFDRLRTRLLSDHTQSLPEEAAETAAQPGTATGGASVVTVEVIDKTSLPLADEQSDSSAQPPSMTLSSLRDLITAAELLEAEQPDANSTLELAQAQDANSLPVLEGSEPPAVEPEEETVEEEFRPVGTDEIPAEPGRGEDEIILPAESTIDIEGLPNSLFSDPNPLSFPTQASEVDVDQNPVVTLEQAIALAYQNNQTLQASLLALEQAEAGVEAAGADRLPTVGVGANLNSTQNNGSRTTLGGSVEVQYDVLTGGTREATIRAAELQREVSALTVEAQQEQIRLATANSYYDLQNAGEQIRINQSFLDEAARNLRDAQLRQDVGVGTKFDTLRAEVQFANARQSLIQAQGSQRIARRDISRLLNLPPTSGLTATPVQVAETWPLTLEESILLAFQNRAELEQQLLQADISEQQRRQALAAVRPQVSVFASYAPQFIINGASAFEDDFQDSVSFGARLNWQLYDGGAARARARQQEIGSAIAEEQFSETLDQVRFDVEQAYFNLETNQENILTSQIAVAQAEEALALANLRLQAGVGTQLDVLTAQSELTQAQGNNVAAILGYNRALVAIERAISNVATPF